MDSRLTKPGVALVALQCASLVFVLATLVLLPESAQGIGLRTPVGLVVAAFVLSGGLCCMALVLKAMGIEVARRVEEGDSVSTQVASGFSLRRER
jgi:hypothetical protein